MLSGLGGGPKGPHKELGGTETGKASWVGRAGQGKQWTPFRRSAVLSRLHCLSSAP